MNINSGMQIVTLITDLGYEDHYAAILKGRLLRTDPTLQLVDITHGIQPFDIAEAAFVLRNSWFHFPNGTIHICTVLTGEHNPDEWIAIKHLEHYFLLPANGIFSLAFPDLKTQVRAYQLKPPSRIPYSHLADAIRHLLHKEDPEKIGPPVEITQRISLQPVVGPDYIRGEIIHIDRYGNVISNITKALFDKVGRGRRCKVYFHRYDPILRISQSYQDVEPGEQVCLFNSSNLLEIGINMGNAAQLYALSKDSTIQIDFFD